MRKLRRLIVIVVILSSIGIYAAEAKIPVWGAKGDVWLKLDPTPLLSG